MLHLVNCIWVQEVAELFYPIKMLTFTGTVARTSAFYGRGSGLIMVTYVGCTGEEQSLLSCTHTGYGVTSCSHSADAGVSCPGIITL